MISGCVVCQCPCALEAHENELAKIMLSKQMKEAAEKKKGDGNDCGLLGLLQGLASSREQANLTPSVQQAHGGRVSFSSGSSSNSSSSSCSGSHFERMSTNLMKRGMTDTARREFQNHVKPTTTLKPGGQEFQVAAATNGTSARTRRRHDANRLHGNPNKAAVDVVEIDGSEDEHEGSSDCLDLGLDLSGGNEFMGLGLRACSRPPFLKLHPLLSSSSFLGESLVQCALPYTAGVIIYGKPAAPVYICPLYIYLQAPLSTCQAHAKHTAARGSALTRSRSARKPRRSRRPCW